MASSNRQRDATVRIIERIVVAPAPRRTPPPLVITFTRGADASTDPTPAREIHAQVTHESETPTVDPLEHVGRGV